MTGTNEGKEDESNLSKMDEQFDNFTKRKAPNAYVMFVQHFMNNYKATQADGNQRFRGGIPKAIEDPLVIDAWQVSKFMEFFVFYWFISFLIDLIKRFLFSGIIGGREKSLEK